MRKWLQFDVNAGWGTDRFEVNVPADYVFPAAWSDADRRLQGRDILNYKPVPRLAIEVDGAHG